MVQGNSCIHVYYALSIVFFSAVLRSLPLVINWEQLSSMLHGQWTGQGCKSVGFSIALVGMPGGLFNTSGWIQYGA